MFTKLKMISIMKRKLNFIWYTFRRKEMVHEDVPQLVVQCLASML